MNTRASKCCKNQEKRKYHLKLELDLGVERQTDLAYAERKEMVF